VTRFADDGCLKVSNNAAERAILLIALGVKNIFLPFPTPAAARANKPTPSSTAEFHRNSARNS
jgi:hypothetical protein